MPADDGNGFNLPSSDNLFPDANDTSQLVMSSQVLSQPNNPFVGKNATDNNTLTINSAVVMLSLTNETGANIDLGKDFVIMSHKMFVLVLAEKLFASLYPIMTRHLQPAWVDDSPHNLQ